jgi:hypothetical protein
MTLSIQQKWHIVFNLLERKQDLNDIDFLLTKVPISETIPKDLLNAYISELKESMKSLSLEHRQAFLSSLVQEFKHKRASELQSQIAQFDSEIKQQLQLIIQATTPATSGTIIQNNSAPSEAVELVKSATQEGKETGGSNPSSIRDENAAEAPKWKAEMTNVLKEISQMPGYKCRVPQKYLSILKQASISLEDFQNVLKGAKDFQKFYRDLLLACQNLLMTNDESSSEFQNVYEIKLKLLQNKPQ